LPLEVELSSNGSLGQTIPPGLDYSNGEEKELTTLNTQWVGL